MPKSTSRDHYEMRDSLSSPQGKKNRTSTGFYGFNGEEASSSTLQRRTPNGQVYYAANEHQQQPAARRTPSNNSTSTGGAHHSANTSASSRQPTITRAPTTEEVEEKIRNLKKTMANDNSSRLAAYEARKHVMADARRKREDEARMAAMEQPPSNLQDYQQDLSSPWIAQSASRVLHSVHADDLEREGVEFGNDKPQHRQHHRDQSASRSQSVTSTASRASSQEGGRGPYNPTVGGVFPKNKYIDPSDVVYVNVQGRVNQLINQRRAASSQRQPSSEYGTVATYTHELETARMRRALGQDRLRSEHHYSSYGVMSEEEADAAHWRQQPLRTIKTVDWRSKDESLIMGKTPKSVKLRMRHTESVLACSALRPVLDQSEIKAGHVPDQKKLQRASKRPQRTASQMAAQSFSALARTQSRGLNVSNNPFNSSVGLVPHATASRGLESTLAKQTAGHRHNNASVSAAVEYTPRSRFEVPFDTELSPMSDCTAAGSPGRLGSTLKPHTMEALPTRHTDQQQQQQQAHYHPHDHRSPSPAHSSATDRESSITHHDDNNNRNDVIRRAVEAQRRKLIQQGVIKERPRSTTTAAPSHNSNDISSIRDHQDGDSLAGYSKSDYTYYKARSSSYAAPPKQHHQQRAHDNDMSSMSNNSRYVSPSKEEILEAPRYGGMSAKKSSSPRQQHGRGQPPSSTSPALKSEEVRKTLFSPEQARPDPRFERYSPPRPADSNPPLSARERLLAVSRQSQNQPDNWRSAREDIVKQHAAHQHGNMGSQNVSWVDTASPPPTDARRATSNSTHVLVDDGFTDASKSAQNDSDFWGLGQRTSSHPTMGHGFGSIRSDLFHPTARQGAPQPTAAPKPHEPEGSGHPHRPHPSRDSVGAKRTTDPGYEQHHSPQASSSTSFDIARRAFSMGAPLPHEAAPPHQVRGDQQVSYYQEEEAAFDSLKHSPPPQPNDPTRALLMQVLSAQQERRR